MLIVQSISTEAFRNLCAKEDAMAIIDVRTPQEFKACHVKGASLHPLRDLSVTKVILETEAISADGPIYLLCKGGARATKAAVAIMPETPREVYVVDGGTDACVAAGIPVNKTALSMPVARQVLAVAGGAILLGVALGVTVSPVFYSLSALVGVMLAFVGATGSTVLSACVARLPWNNAAMTG